MEFVGLISSIATLVLFVLYFIGRFIRFFLSKSLIAEKIYFYEVEDLPSDFIIVEHFVMDETSAKFCLVFPNGARRVRCYEYSYDESQNKYVKENVAFEYGNLNIDESISIQAELAECFMKYEIEYLRNDYILSKFSLLENGYNGILNQNITNKATLRGILYYMVE